MKSTSKFLSLSALLAVVVSLVAMTNVSAAEPPVLITSAMDRAQQAEDHLPAGLGASIGLSEGSSIEADSVRKLSQEDSTSVYLATNRDAGRTCLVIFDNDPIIDVASGQVVPWTGMQACPELGAFYSGETSVLFETPSTTKKITLADGALVITTEAPASR